MGGGLSLLGPHDDTADLFHVGGRHGRGGGHGKSSNPSGRLALHSPPFCLCSPIQQGFSVSLCPGTLCQKWSSTVIFIDAHVSYTPCFISLQYLLGINIVLINYKIYSRNACSFRCQGGIAVGKNPLASPKPRCLRERYVIIYLKLNNSISLQERGKPVPGIKGRPSGEVLWYMRVSFIPALPVLKANTT